MYFFGSLGVLLVVAVGAARYFVAALCSWAILVAFLVLASFLYEPIGKLHELNQLVQAGRAAGERVFEILDSASEPDGWRNVRCRQCAARLSSGMSVSATPGELPTLTDISFHARPGETIALVGTTGAGKSTADQSARRASTSSTSGEILVDGSPIRDFSIRALRQHDRDGDAGKFFV